jgi:hypothetical protein
VLLLCSVSLDEFILSHHSRSARSNA